MRRNDLDDATSALQSSLQDRLAYDRFLKEQRRHDPHAPMGHVALPAGVPAQVAEGIAWAQFLESNLDRFQRTLDVVIGDQLGCGRFGCVFQSTSPWVVKITRDESEGPIWSYMQELLDDPEFRDRLPSFLRVHDVVRILPDVVFNGEEQPVYAIVREEAAPVFEQVQVVNPRDKYDTSFETAMSEQTLAILGATPSRIAKANLQRPVLYKHMAEHIRLFPKGVQEHFAELHLAIQAVRTYRSAALTFHDYRWVSKRTVREEAALKESHETIMAACSILRRLPVSMELGETLITSHEEADLVFRDLHIYNVGWRTHKTIERRKLPQCLVILDPGAMATPYMPEIREVRLLQNAEAFLRNAGLL